MIDTESIRQLWVEKAASVIADTCIDEGRDATARSLAQALDAAGLGGQEFSIQIVDVKDKPTWIKVERLGVPIIMGFVNTDLRVHTYE